MILPSQSSFNREFQKIIIQLNEESWYEFTNHLAHNDVFSKIFCMTAHYWILSQIRRVFQSLVVPILSEQTNAIRSKIVDLRCQLQSSINFGATSISSNSIAYEKSIFYMPNEYFGISKSRNQTIDSSSWHPAIICKIRNMNTDLCIEEHSIKTKGNLFEKDLSLMMTWL